MKTLFAALMFTAVVVVAVAVADKINYCDKSWCATNKSFKTHVACNNNGLFADSCHDSRKLVSFDKNMQNFIVSELNEKRNLIAGGEHIKYKRACNMATMQWDPELAYMAELNVKKCRMNHDCHSTTAYPHSGQNLASPTFHNVPDYKALVHTSVEEWYKEAANCEMEFIKKFPAQSSGKKIGHFTAMMTDRNNRVGCAASTYFHSEKYGTSFLFTCNFAFANMANQPIYTDCTKAGEKCKTGKNSKYNNLCSAAEKYKV